MVRVVDLQSGDPKFRSEHYLDLFLGVLEFKSLAMLVNDQLVCSWPVGILSNVQFELNVICFLKISILPPRKGFFLRPPTHPSGIIHFFKFFGLTEPPTPQEIPIPPVGGVWIFSGTAQYANYAREK